MRNRLCGVDKNFCKLNNLKYNLQLLCGHTFEFCNSISDYKGNNWKMEVQSLGLWNLFMKENTPQTYPLTIDWMKLDKKQKNESANLAYKFECGHDFALKNWQIDSNIDYVNKHFNEAELFPHKPHAVYGNDSIFDVSLLPYETATTTPENPPQVREQLQQCKEGHLKSESTIITVHNLGVDAAANSESGGDNDNNTNNSVDSVIEHVSDTHLDTAIDLPALETSTSDCEFVLDKLVDFKCDGSKFISLKSNDPIITILGKWHFGTDKSNYNLKDLQTLENMLIEQFQIYLHSHDEAKEKGLHCCVSDQLAELRSLGAKEETIIYLEKLIDSKQHKQFQQEYIENKKILLTQPRNRKSKNKNKQKKKGQKSSKIQSINEPIEISSGSESDKDTSSNDECNETKTGNNNDSDNNSNRENIIINERTELNNFLVMLDRLNIWLNFNKKTYFKYSQTDRIYIRDKFSNQSDLYYNKDETFIVMEVVSDAEIKCIKQGDSSGNVFSFSKAQLDQRRAIITEVFFGGYREQVYDINDCVYVSSLEKFGRIVKNPKKDAVFKWIVINDREIVITMNESDWDATAVVPEIIEIRTDIDYTGISSYRQALATKDIIEPTGDSTIDHVKVLCESKESENIYICEAEHYDSDEENNQVNFPVLTTFGWIFRERGFDQTSVECESLIDSWDFRIKLNTFSLSIKDRPNAPSTTDYINFWQCIFNKENWDNNNNLIDPDTVLQTAFSFIPTSSNKTCKIKLLSKSKQSFLKAMLTFNYSELVPSPSRDAELQYSDLNYLIKLTNQEQRNWYEQLQIVTRQSLRKIEFFTLHEVVDTKDDNDDNVKVDEKLIIKQQSDATSLICGQNTTEKKYSIDCIETAIDDLLLSTHRLNNQNKCILQLNKGKIVQLKTDANRNGVPLGHLLFSIRSSNDKLIYNHDSVKHSKKYILWNDMSEIPAGKDEILLLRHASETLKFGLLRYKYAELDILLKKLNSQKAHFGLIKRDSLSEINVLSKLEDLFGLLISWKYIIRLLKWIADRSMPNNKIVTYNEWLEVVNERILCDDFDAHVLLYQFYDSNNGIGVQILNDYQQQKHGSPTPDICLSDWWKLKKFQTLVSKKPILQKIFNIWEDIPNEINASAYDTKDKIDKNNSECLWYKLINTWDQNDFNEFEKILNYQLQSITLSNVTNSNNNDKYMAVIVVMAFADWWGHLCCQIISKKYDSPFDIKWIDLQETTDSFSFWHKVQPICMDNLDKFRDNLQKLIDTRAQRQTQEWYQYNQEGKIAKLRKQNSGNSCKPSDEPQDRDDNDDNDNSGNKDEKPEKHLKPEQNNSGASSNNESSSESSNNNSNKNSKTTGTQNTLAFASLLRDSRHGSILTEIDNNNVNIQSKLKQSTINAMINTSIDNASGNNCILDSLYQQFDVKMAFDGDRMSEIKVNDNVWELGYKLQNIKYIVKRITLNKSSDRFDITIANCTGETKIVTDYNLSKCDKSYLRIPIDENTGIPAHISQLVSIDINNDLELQKIFPSIYKHIIDNKLNGEKGYIDGGYFHQNGYQIAQVKFSVFGTRDIPTRWCKPYGQYQILKPDKWIFLTEIPTLPSSESSDTSDSAAGEESDNSIPQTGGTFETMTQTKRLKCRKNINSQEWHILNIGDTVYEFTADIFSNKVTITNFVRVDGELLLECDNKNYIDCDSVVLEPFLRMYFLV